MRDQEKVAKPPQLAQTGWCGQGLFDHTTRPLLQRRLRCFFLMSRPPLLLLRRGVRLTTPEFFTSCSQWRPPPNSSPGPLSMRGRCS